MYITSYSIRIVLLSRYVNIYDTMAPMSEPFFSLLFSEKDMGGRSLFAEGTAFSWLFLTKWGRNGDARIREKACAFGAAPLFELRIRGYAANLTLIRPVTCLLVGAW